MYVPLRFCVFWPAPICVFMATMKLCPVSMLMINIANDAFKRVYSFSQLVYSKLSTNFCDFKQSELMHKPFGQPSKLKQSFNHNKHHFCIL